MCLIGEIPPEDLVVPGFLPIDQLSHKFEGKKLAVNLGDVNTHRHE